MDAIGIVEALNKKFECMECKKGVHFILHKKIECNTTAKAYKEYDYTLWYINDNNKYQVKRIVHTARITNDREESNMLNYMEEQLLISIYNLLLDSNLKAMIDGSFTGYAI